jgi:hexosaminidase
MGVLNAFVLVAAILPLVPAPRSVRLTGGTASSTNVAYVVDAAVPSEGYRLTIGPCGATVVSGDSSGAFYARQSLAMLPKPWPCLEMEDCPAYRWRGLHLDESRHFFGKETVKALLDKMAAHKLNVFHWHLTDDQGWRIDVPGYPELVRYGAVRSASPRHGTHPSRGTVAENAEALNGTRYGPYWYSESDLREIVAYAAERHIDVVPEVELPGHVYAALAAYPEFACFPENLAARDPRTIWGIEKDVLCVGNPRAISFMEDVLDYVCRVFPGRYVHIGGDECPADRWRACPKCRAFRIANAIPAAELQQAWVTRHFAKFLVGRGKRAVVWDECLAGDVPADVVGMSWRDPGCVGAGQAIVSPVEAMGRGHEMVMSPNSYCYLDYGQGLEDDRYQYARRTLTLERAYQFDPCAGVPVELRGMVLGGQGNNWTEYTWNEYDLDWKVWPRAAALAECLWLGSDRPGFPDFKARLPQKR